MKVLWFATLNGAVCQEPLVKDLLLVGSLFVLYGESNSGKTFWILDLGLAIARGASFRGRRTKSGLVVYIAGEGYASVRARIAAYKEAHPGPDGLPFVIIPQAVDFLSSESVGSLIETIRATESESGKSVVLVIVDTFARSIPGGNENDAQDVGLAVASADRVRMELKCCVGFIHHAGKDPTKGARGSSALRAATDTEIMIEGQTGQRTATVTKQRDLECGEPMPFELVPIRIGADPDDGQDITSCIVRHVDVQEKAADVVQLRGKSQRRFVAAMRARTESESDRIWTLSDLRQVGKELSMSKSTARYVVNAVVATTYMQPTVGGYRFIDGVHPQ
jgi:hypothetical protein